METARDRLRRMLAEKSFRLGEFTLSSGARSDYYVDCRATTLDAEGARLTGLVLLQEIAARDWRPQAIGGMTLGADPLVTAVAAASAERAEQRGPASADPEDLDQRSGFIHGFLVRKAEKQHGTGQRIEGFCRTGARAVVVDDVCTTGGSTVQAIAAARAAGMEVVGVLCLVEREEMGARAAVERAAAPAPFVSIFKASEVRTTHREIGAPGDRGIGVIDGD